MTEATEIPERSEDADIERIETMYEQWRYEQEIEA
jgi:hypothetical protein